MSTQQLQNPPVSLAWLPQAGHSVGLCCPSWVQGMTRAPWEPCMGTLGILCGDTGDPAGAPWRSCSEPFCSNRKSRCFTRRCSQPSLWKSRSHTRGKCWGSSAPTHGALTELPSKLVSANHAAPAPAPHLETAHKALSPHRREEGGRRTSPTSPALPAWWV